MNEITWQAVNDRESSYPGSKRLPSANPRQLSDGSLATDPWPGFDLHPIRSTPEDNAIGRLAGEVGGAWEECRWAETKEPQREQTQTPCEWEWSRSSQTKHVGGTSRLHYQCFVTRVCVIYLCQWKVNMKIVKCKYELERFHTTIQLIRIHFPCTTIYI
jgi:hypothetical protein